MNKTLVRAFVFTLIALVFSTPAQASGFGGLETIFFFVFSPLGLAFCVLILVAVLAGILLSVRCLLIKD